MHAEDCGTDHALIRNKLLTVQCNIFRSNIKCSPSINSAAMIKVSSTSLFQPLPSNRAMTDYPENKC